MKKLLYLILLITSFSYGQTAEEYFDRGYTKHKLKDYERAIADYTKAIEINPNDAKIYLSRGASKDYFNDFNGAIADFTKAIEINPNFASAYFNRGFSKYYSKDSYGACIDAKKAQDLGYDATELINIVCK